MPRLSPAAPRARRPIRRLAHLSARAVVALHVLGACEHPIAVVTPHAEVADVVLADGAGGALARTRDNRRWEGAPLALCDGRALDLRPTLLDFQNAPVDLVARRDLSLRGEIDGAPLATFEPLAGGRARLHAHAAGATRVRFLVWHVSHPDLVTPWLDVVVRPAGAPECAARTP